MYVAWGVYIVGRWLFAGRWMPGEETKIGNCEKILGRIVFDLLPGARELPGVCTLLGVGMLLGEEAKIRNTRKFLGRSCLLIAWRECVARRVRKLKFKITKKSWNESRLTGCPVCVCCLVRVH